jgi:hypothetical protein
VASRILVGKMLMVSRSFPVVGPSRSLCRLYQYTGPVQGDGDGTTPGQKGYGGLFIRVRGRTFPKVLYPGASMS